MPKNTVLKITTLTWASFFTIMMLLISPFAFAEVRYVMTDLGTLGGDYSVAYGLNDRGQIVGRSSVEPGNPYVYHAFLWENNIMTDIGTLSGSTSCARAINSFGTIVGYYDYTKGFIWENNVMTYLGSLGTQSSQGYGINDQKQIAGNSYIDSLNDRAFLWENGQMTELPHLGGNQDYAYAINENKQIVGFSRIPSGAHRACIWENGSVTNLSPLGEGWSGAIDINSSGQIVGYFGNNYACLWENGQMAELGTLEGVNGYEYTTSCAFAVNDLGYIVGSSHIDSDLDHAFIWNDGVMKDLNDLILVDSGCVLNQAKNINKFGQIIADGKIAGNTHGILLTPVYEYPGDFDNDKDADGSDLASLAHNSSLSTLFDFASNFGGIE